MYTCIRRYTYSKKNSYPRIPWLFSFSHFLTFCCGCCISPIAKSGTFKSINRNNISKIGTHKHASTASN